MRDARKLKPPADDASGPREARDLSIADPADCPILDDQAVQEILESGPYPLLDQSIDDDRDDMDDKEKTEATDTFVPDFYLTRKAELLETITQIQRGIEEPETLAMLEEYIEGESPTVRHHYQPPRVGWAQRVLNWFRRS